MTEYRFVTNSGLVKTAKYSNDFEAIEFAKACLDKQANSKSISIFKMIGTLRVIPPEPVKPETVWVPTS